MRAELAHVIWAVQMSTVEFHPWNSRRADTERPDEWRIDLDPMPDCPFDRVRRVAHVAREVLDELGAVGWPKTSGGSGLHVYVRIRPEHGFADVRRAALAFAREVERRAPDDVTTTWWRRDRDPSLVFVDYNQNARDHTIASAYSVRGTPDATVSTPLRWDRCHAAFDPVDREEAPEGAQVDPCAHFNSGERASVLVKLLMLSDPCVVAGAGLVVGDCVVGAGGADGLGDRVDGLTEGVVVGDGAAGAGGSGGGGDVAVDVRVGPDRRCRGWQRHDDAAGQRQRALDRLAPTGQQDRSGLSPAALKAYR